MVNKIELGREFNLSLNNLQIVVNDNLFTYLNKYNVQLGEELPEISYCQANVDNTKAYGMVLKNMFLKNGYDTNLKYWEIFVKSEDNIKDICVISDFARFLIKCESIKALIDKRKSNVLKLSYGLEEIGINGIRKFDTMECPLVYSLRVKNRDDFRRYLMDNRIYCAIHWSFDGYKPEERPNGIYNAKTLISLPVDQRYGDKEISYLLDVISKYGGELSF